MDNASYTVFGLRVESQNSRDVIDDITDQLEDDGITEEEWDFLAWELHDILHVVFKGSYLIRASLMKLDYVDRVESVLDATATMKSNRSRWVYPSRRRGNVPISDVASTRLDGWIRNQFPKDGGEQKAIETILSGGTSAVTSKPLQRRRGPGSTKVGKAAVNNLREVISGGKSEEGEGFGIFSFDDKAPVE